MAKDFSSFEGSIPDSQDEYHIAGDGFVRLINFAVNHTELRPQHYPIVDQKLIPFLLAATKALGPGDYKLRCVGTASATGSFDGNAVLSDGRALNAAKYAIKSFEAQVATNPHVADCKLTPDPKPAADTAAREDVIARKLAPNDVERKQNHFRAAMFILSAGKKHPKGSEIFQIREIYLFKFTSKEEPLPDALKHIKQVIENKSLILKVAKKLSRLKPLVERIELFSKTLDNALGPEGKLALIMIKFMIPQEMDSCYEIKNSANIHALYRMNGSGNRLSFGLTDMLDIVAESIAATKGVIKAIKSVLGAPKSLDKTVQFLEKFNKELHTDAVEFAGTFGPGFAEFVDVVLTMAENGVTARAMFAPSSPFVPFVFHDRTAKHQVAQLSGPARRTVFGAAFNEAVDIEFGGFVPNNWRAFQAEAKITRIIVDLVEIETSPHGSFSLLKGNYSDDLIVGPTDIVKD